MTELKDQLDAARGLIAQHFPNGDEPEGLFVDCVHLARDHFNDGFEQGYNLLMSDLMQSKTSDFSDLPKRDTKYFKNNVLRFPAHDKRN
jgi:hypothetical protein